ncbi:MAG: sigma-70 family RNA polymerase sigma factor [Nannocystaceae bacterium]|nr:sigma-70 family RNA polymerase sigma factor [Nannocystaceae bacterium]
MRRGYAGVIDDAEELELLQRWRAGDGDAGSALIRRHFAAVFRYFASQLDELAAEDLTQRTFEACIDGRDRIEGGLRAYLFGVARNQLALHLRQAMPRRGDVAPSQVELPDPATSPSAALRDAEHAHVFLQALTKLSDKLREVIELYYRDELDVRAIATRLGISTGTVKSRLFRAREQLIEEIRALHLPAALERSSLAALGDVEP